MRSILTTLLVVFTVSLHAQKLPNVQQVSLRAPANIKMDGYLNEWNDRLQIRNSIDGISYTISNNNENLYLTLIAPYQESSKKAVRGGVTFSVSMLTNRRRSGDPAVKSVTFPLSKNSQNYEFFLQFEPNSKIKTNLQRDSLARLVSKNANALFKTMKVGDEILSIYNDKNIVTGIRFNSNLDMIYELAIPLEYLGLDIKYDKPFSYSIRLNGKNADSEIKFIPTAAHPTMPAAPIAPPGTIPPPPDPRFMATELWREYTLAK